MLTADFICFSFFLFYLDRGVEDTKLFLSANPVNVSHRFVAKIRSHMASKDELATSKLPAMEVVHFFDRRKAQDFVVQGLDIDFFRTVLHDDAGALQEDGHGGHQDQDREEESADGVSDLPVWSYLDDNSC